MDGLVAVPHADGIQLLKDKLFSDITKFSLVDENGELYYTADIHSVFFDTNGILTASIIIPKEDNFTSWNSGILLQTDDDVIVCTVPTQPIKFVTGIGGEQEVKLTISGDASTIVFKKDEYITITEAENILINIVKSGSSKHSLNSDKLENNNLEQVLTKALPKSTIITVPTSVVPDGFLECNGAELSRDLYSDLFDAIGTVYGAGDGSTTFNIPDLRGEFIRGFDSGRGIDAGRIIGTYQKGSLIAGNDNQDTYNGTTQNILHNNRKTIGLETPDLSDVPNDLIILNGDSTSGHHSKQSLPSIANWFGTPRPRNIAMMYCIKY